MPASPAPMMMMRSSMLTSIQADVDPAAFHFGGIGLEVDAGGSVLGLAGLVVEAAVVLGALDDVAHHQAVGQVHRLVGAEPGGGEHLVVRAAVYGQGPLAAVDPN